MGTMRSQIITNRICVMVAVHNDTTWKTSYLVIRKWSHHKFEIKSFHLMALTMLKIYWIFDFNVNVFLYTLDWRNRNTSYQETFSLAKFCEWIFMTLAPCNILPTVIRLMYSEIYSPYFFSLLIHAGVEPKLAYGQNFCFISLNRWNIFSHVILIRFAFYNFQLKM